MDKIEAVIVDLPEELFAADRERAEIVLEVRIVVLSEGCE